MSIETEGAVLAAVTGGGVVAAERLADTGVSSWIAAAVALFTITMTAGTYVLARKADTTE